jgi:hypothetical protein
MFLKGCSLARDIIPASEHFSVLFNLVASRWAILSRNTIKLVLNREKGFTMPQYGDNLRGSLIGGSFPISTKPKSSIYLILTKLSAKDYIEVPAYEITSR